MANQEAVTRAKEIMSKCMFPSFATVDENGCPQIRAMMAAAVEDGFTVYYVTSRQSAKCRHLAVNPKASSLWTEVLDPMRDWRSVCIKGTAVVSDDKALRERFWVEELKPFFPGGVDDPNFVVIIVKPEEMILADQQTFPPQVVSL